MHCIPFAFSQYFMHLEVCLYVENYVVIGLNWVEPMMQFFLHITCSCIFHAYILFLFYLLVLCCDGTFLFVSVFLSDSLHMAPKNKSTPFWNPFHFGASSSDPTPLHIRFCDEKTLQDFSEKLLGELLQTWHSFETSRDSIVLFRYYSIHCHS